jgi:hypothetical protein
MKTMISKTLALVAIAATLLSFSSRSPQGSPSGGEGFEIYLNGKVVLQQFGKEMDAVKSLQLAKAAPTDKLTIRYYHCGRAGKNRTVTIKDGHDNVIKVWKFKDATTVGDMSCTVQDILSLKKGGNNVFKIYYASTELPQGRMLTSVVFGNNALTAAK